MIEADMLFRAERIAAAAAAIAPVYEGTWAGARPGQYKGSFVVTSTSRGGRRKDRAVATVTNTAPYARFVEYGTEKVPAHHVMLRAAAAGGGD
ncbi:HK97 gp10 family phage protein [Streptomyces sp. C10-9-1]|uniref:HK97 gp10 family phage protein n=1 Tax=Streptomyces sp. C10-9-1 TaxID=1859285 RepID=UPI003F49DF9B